MKISNNKSASGQPVSVSRVRERAIRAVDEIYGEFRDFPWDNRQAYGSWLAQTYYFVRHATRLLAYAAARCPLEDEWLHLTMLKGADEERGHEALALNDLKHLNLSIDQFPEYSETASYHQTLYYAIDHLGAAALLGYFIPLEGLAATRLNADYKRVNALYSPRSASFLRVHCDLDVSHFDEGLKLLERVSPTQLAAIERAMEASLPLYRSMIARMVAEAKNLRGSQAA